MAIPYKINELRRKNKETNLTDIKYYAAAVYEKNATSIDDLATIIEERTSLGKTDVKAVLENLADAVVRELRQGRIVDLGHLGRMRLTLRSKAAPQPELFTTDQIYGSKVIFTPGRAFRQMQRSLTYTKVTVGGAPVCPTPQGGDHKPDDHTGL